MDHSHIASSHQLRLEDCPIGCGVRADGVQHWHEECDCGVEYLLARDLDDTSQLIIVAVYDKGAVEHGW